MRAAIELRVQAAGEFPIEVVENARLHGDGLLVGKREAVLDAQLWRPGPEIAREPKSWHSQRREGSGGQRRHEQRVLAGNHGGVLPVQAQAGGLQADEAEIRAVADVGKAAGKIKLDVGRCPGARDHGTENLQSNLRLAQRGSHGGRTDTALQGQGVGREVEIV